MPDELAGWMPLFQTAGIGGVLWFVLTRLEGSIKANTEALNRLSMQVALLLDRSPRAAEAVERLVRDAGVSK